jgi:hypothetical protein
MSIKLRELSSADLESIGGADGWCPVYGEVCNTRCTWQKSTGTWNCVTTCIWTQVGVVQC